MSMTSFLSACFTVCLICILLFCCSVTCTITLTQNITNSEDDVTVFPSIVVQLTCASNTSVILWQIEDGSNEIATLNPTTLGDFSIILLESITYNDSLTVSTATTVASVNTSLTCFDNDGSSSSISIFIKPVIPQISLIQSITNDSTNVTICPNTLVTFTCQSTTGIVVWRTDNGQSSSLARLGETTTLGIFELSVTNVIALDLLVESVASTESAVNDFTLSCHTAVTNGLSSSLSMSIRVVPDPIMSVYVIDVCYDSISFNWTDTINDLGTPQLDYYLVTVSPSPLSFSPQEISDGVSSIITGLSSDTTYTVSISPVNCAGTGNPIQFQRTIVTSEPPVPMLVDLVRISFTNTTSTIFVQWQLDSPIDCLEPPVTTFVIIISGVLQFQKMVSGSETNSTFTVPSCGASAVTMRAVNSAGSSDRSDPLIFTGSNLALFVSATSVTDDSVTLSVTVTQCIRSAIANITVTYHARSTNNTITRTATHPDNSDSALISLTGLQSSTAYSASVVVYYSGNDEINLLGPYNVTFTTTQSQSTSEALIIGLSVGFSVSLIVAAVFIVIIFVVCFRFKKRTKRLQQDFRKIQTNMKGLQRNMEEYSVTQKSIETAVQSIATKKSYIASQVPVEYVTLQKVHYTDVLYSDIQRTDVL